MSDGIYFFKSSRVLFQRKFWYSGSLKKLNRSKYNVNVNKVHAFLNLFSDENRLSDVKDLWDIILMTKKKPSAKYSVTILHCLTDTFFSLKNIVYRLAAGC